MCVCVEGGGGREDNTIIPTRSLGNNVSLGSRCVHSVEIHLVSAFPSNDGNSNYCPLTIFPSSPLSLSPSTSEATEASHETQSSSPVSPQLLTRPTDAACTVLYTAAAVLLG